MSTSPIVDPQWYKKIWSLSIQDMSWVERTTQEVDFAAEALGLHGSERVLDLACGYGRHALELARRGHPVVGVDIAAGYVDEARRRAREGHLSAEFICADLRDVSFHDEFDVALNLADGAIGYLEDDSENLKIFDLVAAALRPGGGHLMAVCNGAYAQAHFPRRHWELGTRSLSLADFAWDANSRRMLYTGYTLRLGEVLAPLEESAPTSTRLYTLDELRAILEARGLHVERAYGGYDATVPASPDSFDLVVCSRKE